MNKELKGELGLGGSLYSWAEKNAEWLRSEYERAIPFLSIMRKPMKIIETEKELQQLRKKVKEVEDQRNKERVNYAAAVKAMTITAKNFGFEFRFDPDTGEFRELTLADKEKHDKVLIEALKRQNKHRSIGRWLHFRRPFLRRRSDVNLRSHLGTQFLPNSFTKQGQDGGGRNYCYSFGEPRDV